MKPKKQKRIRSHKTCVYECERGNLVAFCGQLAGIVEDDEVFVIRRTDVPALIMQIALDCFDLPEGLYTRESPMLSSVPASCHLRKQNHEQYV